METTVKEKIQNEVVKYNITDDALSQLQAQWGDVVIPADDLDFVQSARDAYSNVGKLRREVEAKRKELKDEYLEISKGIDAEAKRIQAVITSVENNLKTQIEAIDAESKREKALKAARKVWPGRLEVLADLNAVPSESESEKIMLMTETEFNSHCGRIRQVKIDEQQAELEKLRREAKERDDAEQRAKDIEAAKVQAAADERARIEREQADAEQRKQREAEQAEAKRKADAEAQAISDAERTAAMSDRERFRVWAQACLDVERPELKSQKAIAALSDLVALLQKVAK